MPAAAIARSKIRLDTPKAAAAFFEPGFAGMRRESLRVAHLDRAQCLVGLRLHYSNLCDSIRFPIGTIVRDAIKLDTSGLLIAHNHPSGDATPSEDDIAATRKLVGVAHPLGIRVLDHLIFGRGGSTSLSAMGLI